MNSIIQAKNLTQEYKVYDKEEGIKGSFKALFKRKHRIVKAVTNVNVSIKEGELIGFIGPNGAGKTTTLKMLSGLLHPTKGSTEVLGYVPYERKKDYLKQISLVMGQKNQLFWDLPAIETFNLNKEIYEVSDKRYREVLDDLTTMLSVEKIMHRQVRTLSLGQRMKCELIAALIHTPKVLYLDEPTIGLDVVVQKKLRSFIRDYNRRYKATIILTSHYMGDLEALCKRVIVIDKGRIGYDGEFSELIKQYAKEKRINLVFEKKVPKEKLNKYGFIKHYKPMRAAIRVKREDIKKVAGAILKELPVDDLDISEMSIESVVRRVFENNEE
jgi:ABC-2 type transport system ATP-binding protein